MSVRLKIFFDGGCRPNPGTMEIAVVVGGQEHVLRDIGYGNSMDAEWLALIHGLRIALSLRVAAFVLLGDSAAVVGQANGTARCRGTSIRHREEFLALAAGGSLPRIRHVPRSQNLAGIALARLRQ